MFRKLLVVATALAMLMLAVPAQALDLTLSGPVQGFPWTPHPSGPSIKVAVLPATYPLPQKTTVALDLDPKTTIPSRWYSGVYTSPLSVRLKVYDAKTDALLCWGDFNASSLVAIDYDGTNWHIH